MNKTRAMPDAAATRDRKGGHIHVCPLSAVPDVVARAEAAHLITLLQEEILVERPRAILPDKHLRLHVHDIAEPQPGCVTPDDTHIAELIAFAREWGGRGPMVVHCWAGISRSTAAAFTALCLVNAEVPEERIARALREASPTAYPNRLMIKLADDALGREGRMMRAVETIGRGVPSGEAAPFSLPADLAHLRS